MRAVITTRSLHLPIISTSSPNQFGHNYLKSSTLNVKGKNKVTMNTETQANTSSDLSLDEMLAILDSEGVDSKSETVTFKNDVGGLSELDKLSTELENLDVKDISDAIRLEGLPVVSGKMETLVISKLLGSIPEPVDLNSYAEEDDLEATLAALSDEIVTDTPSIDPIEPEIKIKPARQKAIRRRETVVRPRFQLSDLTTEDCEKLGVTKEVMIEAVDKCPVKAKDKVLNLAQWALRGNELSVYTQLGIECLIKNNTASSEIFRIYMMSNPTRPYPTTTAGTQAGQLMAVLPAMGIADRIGKNVTLKTDSPLVRMFREQFSQ